ncbi:MULTISPECIES: general stress protein [unclassified Agrococcus]|uniref:general stress protein n=1 Tax=unclassified Agrococcus TaxID=2615065 RepID=UPI003617E9AF
MSILQPSDRGEQRLPDGVVVATFSTYAEAQAAVNRISETEGEIRGLAIVGNDLKLVERVVGRLTWGRVAMGGMLRGLSFGIFFALAIYLLMGDAALQSALVLPLLGAAIGIVLAIVTHSIGRRRRQFSSVQQVLASRYDIVAPQAIAGKTMHAIGQRASAPVTTPAEAPVAPQPESPQP